jgi:PII-like signaling protein
VNEPGIKLTTYFQERARAGDRFLADALLALYEREQIHTSVLLRGAQGFGQSYELHTDQLLTLSESLPAVSIAVDTSERIQGVVPEVLRIARHGLISLERARLVTGPDLQALELSPRTGSAVKLTLYGGRSVRTAGQAGYVAALQLLHRAGAAGASVLLAVDGTLHAERRRARFFARNADVPLMLLAIGDGERITAALPEVARLLDDAVATIERVQICKSGGTHLGDPQFIPSRDHTGLPILQKLMVHTEEQAKWDGHPLHVRLVRRLREAGAAGATVLRGVRGFYGDREPFSDRVLSLRRNVPVHIVVIDTPANVQRLWPLIDDATSHGGLVTSELVPAAHAVAGTDPANLAMASPSARGAE